VRISRTFHSICLAACLAGPFPLRADEEADAWIKQGDVFDRKIQPGEALDLYLAAEKVYPDNVPLMLKIARQYRHLAAEADAKDEKIRLSEMGRDYALRTVKLAPNDAETYLSVAISNAKMIPLLGSKEKLEASRAVKANVDKALAMDPNLDLGWHVLGRWHQRLVEIGPVTRAAARLLYGEIPEGSSETAVACFQAAIKLNPDRLSHYIELGLAYAHIGKDAEARRCLEKGLAMPSVDAGDPECKERARVALQKLK